jgi:asparagine synthase (glutamine-hydrolysing)
MSVQFGRWDFEGQAPAPDYIEKVSAALAPYGPDSNESYSKGGIKIFYRAFHTTKESRCEKQPCISPSGTVMTWDGRLDNRADLISELRDDATLNSTDVAVVAAAYEKWGASCLRKLIGDWAVAIWNPRERSVLLAKDPIGTKHLYYSFDDKRLTWSTILDPLVLFAGKTFEICEEYIAGWFVHLPAAHLTPYVGVHAVPPSSSVLLRAGKHTTTKYWDFDPRKRIRYRTDAEYEEHFRTVFARAVQRRLRSDRPVLAELSGGMDSSSIVCMADSIVARGTGETPRLDTISWYDSSNLDWDDPVYFAKVEERRGRIGFHIDLAAEKQKKESEVASGNSFLSEFESDRLALTPFSNHRRSSEFFKQAAANSRSHGYRVVLSGIGGEQPTGGGVPTPTPELQNLLARARFFTLARQLKAWATKMKKPRLPLLWEAFRGFLPLFLVGLPEYILSVPPWFYRGFVSRNHAAVCGYSSRTKLLGALPSFQEQLSVLDCEQRLMACLRLCPELLCEVRYPYHDRDLREFACAIPRDQIVRVGQRRSLMRRALVGIVPEELLNRKQKALFAQSPPKNLWAERSKFAGIDQHLVSRSMGIIDPNRLCEALEKARRNEEVPIGSLKRTLILESWLRHLSIQGVLTKSVSTKRQERSLEAGEPQAPTQPKSLAS